MKKMGIRVLIMGLLILVSTFILLYFFVFKKIQSEDKIEDNTLKETIKGLSKDNTSKYENGFYIYYSKDEKEFCWYDEISKCSSKRVFIKTHDKDAKVYYEHKDKYVFYGDNDKIKVYDSNKDESYVVNIRNDYYNYNFNVDSLTDEFVGITYAETEDSFVSYYSLLLDKVIYDKEYREMQFVSKDYISGSEFDCDKNNVCPLTRINLLSTNENKNLLSYKLKKDSSGYYENSVYYQLLRNDKGTYICLSTYIDATIYKEIYNTEFKKLYENIGEFSATIDSSGNLRIEKDGIVTVYDKNGKELTKSKKYDVLQIIDDYIVTISDDKLVLITIDGEKTVITDWNKNKNDYIVYMSGVLKEKSVTLIKLGVIDSTVTIDEYWNYCTKNDECSGISKDEISEMDCSLGYIYYYNKNSKELSKVPASWCYM